jgi:hypothetical protein
VQQLKEGQKVREPNTHVAIISRAISRT